jgi:hypothetical protein
MERDDLREAIWRSDLVERDESEAIWRREIRARRSGA